MCKLNWFLFEVRAVEMQIKFHLRDMELGGVLTEHLKSTFISGSLYKANQKKSKFHYYEFTTVLIELITLKVHW